MTRSALLGILLVASCTSNAARDQNMMTEPPDVSSDGTPAAADAASANPLAPTFTSSVGAQQVFPGDLLSFDLDASDPAGNPMTFSSSTLPSGAMIFPHPQSVEFGWRPEVAGDDQITFTVSDATTMLSSSVTVPIHVGDITYPDLPIGSAVDLTTSGTFTIDYCATVDTDGNPAPCGSTALSSQAHVAGTSASCTLTGSNPGRISAACTLGIPAFQAVRVMSPDLETVGPYTVTGTAWLDGNEHFIFVSPDDTITSWAWQGETSMGPIVTLHNIQVIEDAYRDFTMFFGVPTQ